MLGIGAAMMKSPVVLVAVVLTAAILLAASLLIATGTRGEDAPGISSSPMTLK
jgi:hypothetical protein